MTETQTRTVADLMERAGHTFAEDAGITLKDEPKPLFQLLVLTLLLSARISADIATHAARELFRSGWRTPQALASAPRQDVIAALKRGHYSRYDETRATELRLAAERVEREYHGDVRRLAEACDGDPGGAAAALEEFDGIGPVGADIFLREVQDLWPWLKPHMDARVLRGADELHLPHEGEWLADMAPGGRVAPLAAALVRVTLDKDLRADVLAARGS
ncbi:endonuclease [Prescottella agglutinans]|uniref:Endonuclease III n=1 Tax=Prescottella agglutinans TaxID=1644129 RepID=A0ABT6M6X0_9NOCA|nr:endonuclease [Prescottella agglutinans]MDH6280053.1 endonuclease III [Prescottella agglutinans]